VKQVDVGALFEAIPDAVVVSDMASRVVYANAAVQRLLGWRPDELIGQSLHVIQPERLHGAHDLAFERYVESGRQTLFDVPIRLPARRSDGTEQDVELNLAEVQDREGRRLIIGVLRDLSERVELERHLEILRYLTATTEAATRLRTTAEPAAMLEVLTDTLAGEFGAALARAWLYETSEKRLRLVSSHGMTRRVAGSSRELIDVATYPYKVGVVARDRRPVILNELRGDPEFDQAWVAEAGLESVACLPMLAGRRLLGVVVAFFRHALTDELSETVSHLVSLAAAAVSDGQLMAQERDARAAADRARGHFEILADVSRELAGSLDPKVTAQAVSDATVPRLADWCIVDLRSGDGVEMVAAAHRDPALTPAVADLRLRYPPPARRRPRHAIMQAMESGMTVVSTVTDRDLGERAVDAAHLALLRRLGIGSHVVVPLAARDRVIGAVSFVRMPERSPFDADEVATAEAVAQRTALAIDNALLYRSAQQAVALRDRFLAVASHELRTPLAIVRGHWELLARRVARWGGAEARPAAIDETIRRLGGGIDQLQRLVEDLLDADRLRGTMRLQMAEFDLVSFVRDIAAGLPHAERRRVKLTLPSDELRGTLDRERLAQVLGNLLGNALKYSPGDAPVEVALSDVGGRARLEVADRGIGIAADQVETIFEPFSRAPNAAPHRGLGLGLSISREIITQMGGRIWARSPGEGLGSTFIVDLPLIVEAGPHGD